MGSRRGTLRAFTRRLVKVRSRVSQASMRPMRPPRVRRCIAEQISSLLHRALTRSWRSSMRQASTCTEHSGRCLSLLRKIARSNLASAIRSLRCSFFFLCEHQGEKGFADFPNESFVLGVLFFFTHVCATPVLTRLRFDSSCDGSQGDTRPEK